MKAPVTLTTEPPEIKRLRAIEATLIDVAGEFKLPLKLAPESTYAFLTKATPDLVSQAGQHLSELTETFLACASEKIDPWDDVKFFRLSMRRMGLSYPADFLDHVSDGDLIEGYNMNRLQIFRNLAFMEKSGYSLLEIISYDWPTLFDRPSAITQRMVDYTDEILWTANRTIPLEIPTHFVRERASADRLMWEIQFRYLSPLFSGPERPFGILGTCRVKTISSSHPIEHTTFI